jgi:hypothetical protein
LAFSASASAVPDASPSRLRCKLEDNEEEVSKKKKKKKINKWYEMSQKTMRPDNLVAN